MEKQKSVEEYFKKQGLETSVIEEICQSLHYRTLQKGEILLHMGEHTDELCLVIQGLLRGVYVNEDGDEVTKCFTCEGQWCLIYNLISEEPSKFWIEALEDCLLAVFSVKALKELLKNIPELKLSYDKLFLHAFVLNENRTYEFQMLTATKRYEAFLKQYSSLVPRIDQKYIASYLGITPSSLSRIRKSIKMDDK